MSISGDTLPVFSSERLSQFAMPPATGMCVLLPRVSAEFGLPHFNGSGLDVVSRASIAIAALYSAQQYELFQNPRK